MLNNSQQSCFSVTPTDQTAHTKMEWVPEDDNKRGRPTRSRHKSLKEDLAEMEINSTRMMHKKLRKIVLDGRNLSPTVPKGTESVHLQKHSFAFCRLLACWPKIATLSVVV